MDGTKIAYGEVQVINDLKRNDRTVSKSRQAGDDKQVVYFTWPYKLCTYSSSCVSTKLNLIATLQWCSARARLAIELYS